VAADHHYQHVLRMTTAVVEVTKLTKAGIVVPDGYAETVVKCVVCVPPRKQPHQQNQQSVQHLDQVDELKHLEQVENQLARRKITDHARVIDLTKTDIVQEVG